ncbi:MAG: hypothetical protein JWM02_1100 [Frankiales bacterium]|nr:hypothetical protein [Frankiales bacterium]
MAHPGGGLSLHAGEGTGVHRVGSVLGGVVPDVVFVLVIAGGFTLLALIARGVGRL